MPNEPISKKTRAEVVADNDLLLISQKQLDGEFESKSIEARLLKGKDGDKGDKGDKGDTGDVGTISSTYNIQGMLSPDYQNNQNSITSAAGTFLKRTLAQDSFSCYLYYKSRFYLPKNQQFPQARVPTINVKLLSMFMYLDKNGAVVENKEAKIFSTHPIYHSSSSRWYIDVKIIIPEVIFKPSDANALQIGLIPDATSIIDATSAKRLNCSSDLSGFFGILPTAIEGETVAVPQILLSAL